MYRQDRPQTFSEILGQNYIKIVLQNEVSAGKIAQAYLFCGPRAVGKTTTARILAKAANCLNRKAGESEPCNKCQNCLDITAGQNMDIIEIDAASNTGVDNVRENIISSSRIGIGQSSKYKVFIIDEVHMLSTSAFNALLKTLEEPPAHVIFILCTTEIHKIPTTIISRCQRFDFKRISVNDMVHKLENIVRAEKIKIDKTILEAIARQADGYMRDAESLLAQVLALGGDEIKIEEAELIIPRNNLNEILTLIDYLNKKDAGRGIRLINDLLDSGWNLRSFVEDLIEVLRKMALNKVSPNLADSLGLDYGESLEIKINNLNASLNLPQLNRYIERFMIVDRDGKNSFILQLPLELAIIDLCGLSGEPLIAGPSALKEPVLRASASKSSLEPLNPAPSSEIPVAGPLLSLDEINAKWNEVLLKVKAVNHSLSFILQSAKILEVRNNIINLVFKYKFHKDRIMTNPIKELLEKSLAEVYGSRLKINASVDETLEISSPAPSEAESLTESLASPAPILEADGEPARVSAVDDNLLNNILKNFGGEVVG